MKIAEQGKNVLIGAMVIATCAIMVWTLIFLNPTVGDSGRIVRVRFANIDKVTVGTRVAYAGKPIGKVTDILAVEAPRTLDRPGPVYAYELVLAIDSAINVYRTDQFAVHTSGLLGERSVVIVPRRPRPGQILEEVLPDEVMYASPMGSVEETFSGLNSLAKKVEKVLGQLSELLEVNGEDITLAIGSVKNAFERLDIVLQQADESGVVEGVSNTVDSIGSAFKKMEEGRFFENLGSLAKNIDEITAALNQPEKLEGILTGGATAAASFAEITEEVKADWPKVTASIDNVSDSAALIKGIANKMTDAHGTVGKLLSDEGVYLQMRMTMSKVETLMDDINHFGLLFHLDRGWQRQRTRRVNALAELSTPNQFRDFFEQEMTQINTSLSRLSQLVDRTENGGPKDLVKSREFTKAYSELMRRVETLSDTLQMYNEQVCQEGSG